MSVATAIEPVGTSTENYSEVDLSDLRIGSPLFAPIFDIRDVLLLAEGQTVTAAFLERLQDRQIAAVRAHQRDCRRATNSATSLPNGPAGTATVVPADRESYVSPTRNGMSDRLDAEICLGRMQLPQQGEPLLDRVVSRLGRRYEPAAKERIFSNYLASVTKMGSVYDRLIRGEGLDRESLDGLAEGALSDATFDIDLFSCVGGNPADGDYPVKHSVNTAMLAIAIGVRFSLDAPTLRELVVGCLVHDAGMLWLGREVFDHAEQIDRVAFLEITKHPILVFDVLKEASDIPKRSAFIAYQMHERCDGSGYPRRRTGEQIHILSRIAAVADAYVALVSPRPHREALMPYYAMEKMLRDANRGLFDTAAVRGLLRALSLFPIGSHAELSDGRVVRVLRASDDYCRPTVETSDEVIDLAQSPLTVIRAIRTPPE